MPLLRRELLALVGLALPIVTSCEPADRREPGDLPYSFLSGKLGELGDDVDAARAELGADRSKALAHLDALSGRLRRLDEYYLPMLEARHQIARAAYHAASSPASARSALDSAAAVLNEIAGAHGPHLQAEMREPLELIGHARTALESGRVEDAQGSLDRLDRHLEAMFFRGDLVLEGSELRSPEPR